MILLAVALAAPTFGPAEAGRAGPVRVDADEVQYAFQKREVIFSGKRPVTMTRDDATLTCRRAVAHTDEAGQILNASCIGAVRLVRGTRVVTCEQAYFEVAEERVTCEGNPVLSDAGSQAKGTRLVYDLRADEAKLEGALITLPGVEIEERRRAMEERRQKERGNGNQKVSERKTETEKEKKP